MLHVSRRFGPHLILALILLAVSSTMVAVAFAAPLPDREHEYNSAGFVVRHAWTKFAYLACSPFHDDLSQDEEDARLARFFELNALIAQSERTAGDPASDAETAREALAQAKAYREERGDIENTVERILEGRLTQTVKDAGLTRHIGGDIVWPPVDIEFEDPPSVLIKSPRAEIRKESESLLQGDLSLDEAQRIEANAERDGKTSALVVRISGIAMYPAIIPPSSSYAFVLEDIAHEWMHHYLYFTPLGRRYFSGQELTTLNETVANMAGRELGRAMLERYPLPEPSARAESQSPAAAPSGEIDFTAEMRGLRRKVEALLSAGRIDEAERLMEDTRVFLAEHGYYVRRINQAYFAFHGSYADTAGSIDPIGPKLEQLRNASASLEEFVERAREFTSEDALDAALRR